MNRIPLISVIVPVYKAEKYIHRCLDSLLTQTFSDFELILVDDGSPDNSGKICDDYARKDSRIRVFHKENGGVSSARQLGLDNARGEYTIHCDPDDWVEPDWLESLYSAAVNDIADMVICDYRLIYTDHTKQQVVNCSLDPERLFEQITNGKIHGQLWNKLIKRSLIEKADAKFPLKLDCGEDLFFCLQLLLVKPKIVVVRDALYNYNRTNVDAITYQYTDKTSESLLVFIVYLKTLQNRNECSERIKKATENRKVIYTGQTLINSSDAFLKEREKDIPRISIRRAFLFHPVYPVHWCYYFVAICYSLNFTWGIKILRWGYRKIKRMK